MNIFLIKDVLSVMQTNKPFDGGTWATGQLTLQVAMSCLHLLG